MSQSIYRECFSLLAGLPSQMSQHIRTIQNNELTKKAGEFSAVERPRESVPQLLSSWAGQPTSLNNSIAVQGCHDLFHTIQTSFCICEYRCVDADSLILVVVYEYECLCFWYASPRQYCIPCFCLASCPTAVTAVTWNQTTDVLSPTA